MPGTVTFANWRFSWSIPALNGEGLVISKADFNGTRVLFRAGAPFVLVPYHGSTPTFKDGLSPACGGLPFLALVPTAPNVTGGNLPPGGTALNDNQYGPTNLRGAVMVEQIGPTETEPARAVVWAKFQCGNYQYVHRWEFGADGSVHALVGLGGRLLSPDQGGRSHIHNFYFRLDFDIVTSGNNLVQRFSHSGLNAPDQWLDITTEGVQTAEPGSFTTWRVVNKAPKNNGLVRSYELVPGSDGGPNPPFSTGDVWVMRYQPGGEDGANVACNDNVLGTLYANGESVDGQDVVVWYCLRHHHRPRQSGEEQTVLPYEFLGFHLEPRDFLDGTPTNLYATQPPSP
jgi:Cu2+-containing amine oxidase